MKNDHALQLSVIGRSPNSIELAVALYIRQPKIYLTVVLYLTRKFICLPLVFGSRKKKKNWWLQTYKISSQLLCKWNTSYLIAPSYISDSKKILITSVLKGCTGTAFRVYWKEIGKVSIKKILKEGQLWMRWMNSRGSKVHSTPWVHFQPLEWMKGESCRDLMKLVYKW